MAEIALGVDLVCRSYGVELGAIIDGDGIERLAVLPRSDRRTAGFEPFAIEYSTDRGGYLIVDKDL